MLAQEQDSRTWMVCEYSSGGADAVEARQPDIHQNEIGFQRVNGVNGLQSICGFSHDLPWRRTFDHGADVPAPPLVIFDDQDPITQRQASSNRDIGTITRCSLRLPVFRSAFRSFSNDFRASYVMPRSRPLSMK